MSISDNPGVVLVLQASQRGWEWVSYYALDKACLLDVDLKQAIRTAYDKGIDVRNCPQPVFDWVFGKGRVRA